MGEINNLTLGIIPKRRGKVGKWRKGSLRTTGRTFYFQKDVGRKTPEENICRRLHSGR